MFSNYFKVAIRNLRKHKFYAAINIFGLGIGIASFLFILLYIQDELSYDQYHPHAQQTVRVDFHARLGDNEIITSENSAPAGPVFNQEYPEVLTYCRLRNRGSYLVNYKDNTYKEESLIFADSTFFQVFGIPLLHGNSETVLQAPYSIVLSEKMVKKYFGLESPIGKTLRLDNRRDYKVTGVMGNMPSNTHFHYDFLMSMSGLEESRRLENWGSTNFKTYLVLKEGTDLAEFEEKIQTTFQVKFEPVLLDFVGTTWDKFIQGGNYAKIEVMPLTDIYLKSDKMAEAGINGDIRYIYIFGFIGFFILLIAGINFVNLSTARSVNRAKEVGVKKVVGALRHHLIRQFLSESTLIAFIALGFAFILLHAFLPYFNEIASKTFIINRFYEPSFLSATIGITLLIGLLSGIYPAFYLSGFQPIKVLKGSLIGQKNKSLFRNGLVVFQFFITTLLIVGTLVIFQQLSYMQEKKLGYNKEQVLVINDAYALDKNVQAFKKKMENYPSIKSASVTGFLPTPSNRNNSSFFKGKTPTQEDAVIIANWTVDFDYVKTMGLEIIEGRDFDPLMLTDSNAIIINEELAKQLNYENPIGEYMSGYEFTNDGEKIAGTEVYPIIGVIRNFHFASLREAISPLALFIGSSRGAISMRFQSDNIKGLIGQIEQDWKAMAPGQPFSYQFLDERFNRMFDTEQQLGKIAGIFSFLAIFIACIGLLGLATFIAQQRTKEIGIRKVLGADISNLVYLLCKDFGLLILIAFVLAAPIAWYFMNQWLADFAYATSIGIGVFILAGGLILLMAVLSVVYQATRVALINPVETLKWE
jgi:putative ABC transport system permease protein